MTSEQWQKDYTNAQNATKEGANKYAEARKNESNAQEAYEKSKSDLNKKTQELNEAVLNGASQDELNRLKQERDGLQQDVETNKNNVKNAKKKTDNELKAYEELKKQEKKIANADPDKQKKEEAAKAEAKKSKNEEKIKSNIDKCDDPKENIHKTICIKAGLLPSTPYAISFCKWLKTQDTSWYTLDSNNNSKIDATALKALKKQYTYERAAAKEKEKEEKEKAKAEEKAAKEDAKQKAKDLKDIGKDLKKWRQDYLDTQYKNKYLTSKVKVIPDEIDDEDLALLAEAVYEKLQAGGGDGTVESIFKSVWNGKADIIGIKTKMSADALKKAKDPSLGTGATGAFLKGIMSNTFNASDNGIELPIDLNAATQKAELCADVTAASITHLTSKVMKRLEMRLTQIMDMSEITDIPGKAAADVVNHIMTADQVMSRIKDSLNDSLHADLENAEVQERLNEKVSFVSEKAGNIKDAVTEKIAIFTGEVDKIMGKMNQGMDWYIDSANKLEQRYEKTILQEIDNVAETVLTKKQEFVDTLVYQVSYNLAAPINDALEKAQIFIIRQINQLAKQAISKAKALAAKAIMKILGLLGA